MALTFNWQLLLPNFRPEELLSPDTLAYPHLIEPNAARMLQLFRQALGLPITVNYGGAKLRGVRSPKEQLEVIKNHPNGADMSMHVCGRAFDINVDEFTNSELAEKADKFGWGGIGIYYNFLHLDNRRTKDGKPVIWVMK